MPQLTENIWNNQFCFNQVENPKIWIADTVDWTVENLEIWENTAFREMKNWKVVEYKWLKNFIHIKNNNQSIYIFDNHNHALKYWIDEYKQWNIPFWFDFIHIDQHTDMNLSEFELDLENPNLDVYNVWNFIQPAIKSGLINKVEQINTEYKLLNFQTNEKDLILDIDLDFRAPEMSIESYKETIEKVKNLISKSRVVTIATSPYFLNQSLAFKICKDLL
jgi:hypothetical protein